MPSYDYHCVLCDKIFEATHSINDKLNECPTCKENNLPPTSPTRLISKSNFILQGGGWAKEGYNK